MKKLLLVLLLVITFVSAKAAINQPQSGTCGDNLVWALTTDGTLTISGTGLMYDYTSAVIGPWGAYKEDIQTIVIEDGVLSIGNAAFANCVNLENIIIPNSVDFLGEEALYGCTALTSISIPNNVTGIGERAFDHCSNLCELICFAENVPTLGSSVFYDTKPSTGTLYVPESSVDAFKASDQWKDWANIVGISVGGNVLRYNIIDETNKYVEITYKDLNSNSDYVSGSLTIPNSVKINGNTYSVTRIGYYAFRNCYRLNSIIIPNTITCIGSGAFSGCEGLTNINIPSCVTSIGKMAFTDCSNLTNINIPNGVTSIGEYMFAGCSGLTNINIPNSVTSIEDCAFWDCSGLTSINIPNSVTIIGMSAFEDCSSFTCINIPNSVTSIGIATFCGCSRLTSINLGNSITSIGNYAFKYCSNLNEITCLAENVPRLGSLVFEYTKCSTGTLYVPESAADVYKASDQWKDWANIVGISVGGNVLRYNIIDETNKYVEITYKDRNSNSDYVSGSLTIPNSVKINGNTYSVTRIGDYAFANCNELTNINIPDNVTTIGKEAFGACTSLIDISIPKNVQYLRESAFMGCSGLQVVNLYFDGQYNDYCFKECASLKEVNFMGECYFAGMSPYVISAFEGCPNITKILLNKRWCFGHPVYSSNDPEYLHKIFPNAKEFIIPEGITSLGKSVFGYEKLTSITIPSSMETIDCGLSKCESIYISDIAAWCNICFSSNKVFNGANLYLNNVLTKSIILPDDIESINKYIFSGCNSLEEVIFHNNIKRIDNNAFYCCNNLSHVKFPNSQIEFGQDVFYGCGKLISTGPVNSGCSIEYDWSSTIPSRAFSDIPNLQTVIIPSTIESIGEYAFRKSNSGELPITEIYTNAIVPPTISSNTFSDYTATLFVPRDCKEAYSSADYWKKFNIIELVDVESICIEEERYDLIVGESKEINVTILPDKATYKDLYWTIDDPEIAQVNNGVVLGLKTGSTNVTATTTDGTNLSASCTISVTNPVQTVSLNKSQIELEAGDSETITASCAPSDADDISITWKSLNNDVATVVNGTVLAIAVGETEVIASSVNGKEGRCKVFVNPTLATSITINKHELQLTTGKTELLEASIFPAEATSKKVKWDTDNSQVACVDDTGLVKAIANGTATIKASTTDGSDLFDECVVTVTTLATDITLNTENANLIVGQSLPLTATILPSETSNQSITWQSNNTNCATVSVEGIVNALSTGVATITASTNDGTNLSASCIVIVTNPVISVTLDRTSADLMVGQQITITASCIPSNADNIDIMWSSSNNSVASVEQGVVTARALGNATITARSANGIEASCLITVIPTPVASISLNAASISIVKDETYTLICTVSPDDATNKELLWSSLNDDIATVDENGTVTGMTTGETTIIVKAKSDPNVSVSCKVSVSTPVTALRFDCETYELLIDDHAQLYAICTPADADNTRLTWTTSNASVASVDNGDVLAKSEGSAIITATTTDGSELSATCVVNVSRHPQEIIWNQDLNGIVLGGELVTLTAYTSTGLPLVYTSDNENIATIFDFGDTIYLNAIAIGTTDITANQVGNDYYAPVSMTKTVNVIADPAGVNNVTANANGKYSVYTINGLFVGEFTKDELTEKIKTKALARGVYMINGKKMVIK